MRLSTSVPVRSGLQVEATNGLATGTALGPAAGNVPVRVAPEFGLFADQHHKLLAEWNATAENYPRQQTLHGLVEEQVARSPNAVAAEYEGLRLRYRELDCRSNQLATFLRQRGVRPGVRVGVAVDRSVEMLVGLLGILKAGGAYVPLDPAFPAERLTYMMQDAGIRLLVTHSEVLRRLPAHRAEAIRLDADWEAISRESDAAPLTAMSSEELAYVIYTSGSTGRPKGVQIPHRAVVNFLLSMRRQPGLDATDTLLAVTTLSFDIAGLELFLPLIVGARVVVVSRETASNGRRLQEALAKSGATVLQATPATWRLLLDAGWPGSPRLKILCGGEALPLELARSLLSRSAALWNMYGPTETTIWSTVQPITAEQDGISIGRPIANTQAHILDERLQPVPVGDLGELHIGGDGLAWGYHQRPELTAEKFIPDSFNDVPGARLYKTGDLARRLPDGTIECLGRIDHQVKIRGFRIELGDIEAALAQHPAVRQAVVVAREDEPGEKRLVAYLVSQGGQAPEAGELRRFLREKLPEYMTPSAFVPLSGLPLTPNGKIDRRALPIPGPDHAVAAHDSVVPRDALELQLVKIWESTLGIRPIGIRDNLFDLGVHSLQAARLSTAIEERFGRQLPPAPLYQAPTIEQLAGLLRQKSGPTRWSSLVPIQPSGVRPPLFCIGGGKGTVHIFHNLTRHLGPEQPLYGLQAKGLYDDSLAHTRVEEMAAHYLAELKTVQPHGPYFIGGYCFGGVVAFELAQQLRRQGEVVALLAILNARNPAYRPQSDRRAASVRLACRVAGSRADSQKGPAARFGSVLKKAGGAFRWKPVFWARRLHRRLRRLWLKCYLSFDRPVPARLRTAYFLEISEQAEQAYVPQPYPGRMVLFRGDGLDQDAYLGDDPEFGWGGLASGGLEIQLTPGADENRRDILHEPYVATVAEQLKACLQAAHATCRDRSTGL